jgi:nicotinate-nucleotide adenylyltransferase
VGSAAVDALGLTRLFVVPSSAPPHRGEAIASGYHRFAMAAMAVSGHTEWRVSDIEFRSDPPSYTAATLQRFLARGYKRSDLFFILGADAFVEIRSWIDFPRLLDDASFVVVSRAGVTVRDLPERLPDLAGRMRTPPIDQGGGPAIILIDAHTADVSSTAIRARRAAGQSIAGMVDPRVQQHIEQHGLYGAATPGRRLGDPLDIPTAGRLHGED